MCYSYLDGVVLSLCLFFCLFLLPLLPLLFLLLFFHFSFFFFFSCFYFVQKSTGKLGMQNNSDPIRECQPELISVVRNYVLMVAMPIMPTSSPISSSPLPHPTASFPSSMSSLLLRILLQQHWGVIVTETIQRRKEKCDLGNPIG